MTIKVRYSGLATYMALIPLAKNNKLPYRFAIFDRFIRFVPTIMALTALEFLWPLMFAGPFFTRVADFNLEKCTRTWWHNLFFINNFFPVLDIVSSAIWMTNHYINLLDLTLVWWSYLLIISWLPLISTWFDRSSLNSSKHETWPRIQWSLYCRL